MPQILASRPSNRPDHCRMSARLSRLTRESRNLDPASAVALAAAILSDVLADGVTYADFQAAQAAQRDIRAASRKLSGLV